MVKKVTSIKQIPSLHYSGFNSNQMSKEVYDKIKRDVEVNGFLDPYIYYCDDNEIISGNHRVKISRELGLEDTLEYLCLGDLSLEDRIQKAEMFNTRGVPNELVLSLNIYHMVERLIIDYGLERGKAEARIAGKFYYRGASMVKRLWQSGERLFNDHSWMISEVDGNIVTTLHAHYLLNMDRTRRTFLGWTDLEAEKKQTNKELKTNKDQDGNAIDQDGILIREQRLHEIEESFTTLISNRDTLIHKMLDWLKAEYAKSGKAVGVDTLQAEIRAAYVKDFQVVLPDLTDVPVCNVWYPIKRTETVRHLIEEGIALGTYKRDWKTPMTRMTRVSSFNYTIAFDLLRMLGRKIVEVEGGRENSFPKLTVVDPFMGLGVRVMAALVMGHDAYGYDVAEVMQQTIADKWNLSKTKLSDKELIDVFEKVKDSCNKGDARDLPLKDDFADLVFSSPPYWIVEKYEGDIEGGQLSKALTYDAFLQEMSAACNEMKRVVKSGGFIALVVGNFREKGEYYPYVYDIENFFRSDVSFCYHDVIYLPHDIAKPTGGTKSLLKNHTKAGTEVLLIYKKK